MEEINQTRTEQEKLKEALDKSSQVNRTLGLGFAIFVFYMAITVASVTDRDLFIPDSGFSVPFLDLKLGIVDFFLAAPFVILILHYNLLYNLQQHSRKLLNWFNLRKKQTDETDEADEKFKNSELELHPFLFNYALTAQKPLHALALNLVIRITIFMLPLALLVLILIRFADYQSMSITIWHYAAVLLDAALIATHSNEIYNVIKTKTRHDKERFKLGDFFNFRRGGNKIVRWIRNTLKTVVLIIPFILIFVILIPVLVFEMLWNLITRFKIWNKKWLQQNIHYQVRMFRLFRLETFITVFAGIFFILFIYIMKTDVDFENLKPKYDSEDDISRYDSLIIKNKIALVKSFEKVTPRLSLPEEILVKSKPVDALIWMDTDNSYSQAERDSIKERLEKKYTENYILRGRGFRYADLSDTKLTNTDFRDTDFTEANLENAELNYTKFNNAILQGTSFEWANLQGANLSSSQAQGAELYWANLQGAKLIKANLNGADLSLAKLQGAELNDAQLQGALLLDANLQATDLHTVDFTGACLNGAYLDGAELSSAELKGADFSWVKLQGAGLTNINLSGAVLHGTNLQGAHLSGAKLQGTIFCETPRRGAIFENCFSDTILMIKEFQGKDTSLFNQSFMTTMNSLAVNIKDTLRRFFFIYQLKQGKSRFEIDTSKYLNFNKNLKVYRPEHLKNDSSFFFIRRRIASKSKHIAQGMLYSLFDLKRSYYDIFFSLYSDLYLYLKKEKPNYLEGFVYDEKGRHLDYVKTKF
jgi:uncharacterized protein YjbI with pentapeptide repeats